MSGFLSAQYHQESKIKPPVPQVVYVKPVAKEIQIENALTNHLGLEAGKAQDLAVTIAKASNAENVPPEVLTGVIKTESEFKPDAKSKAGAIGYAQIRPKYWKGKTPYNITNEHGNIMAGAYILRQYYEETGSWSDAVKAYNIGITDFQNGKNLHSAEKYHTKVVNNIQLIALGEPQRNIQ